MQSPQKIKRHAILMDRVAEARGLDMEEQVLRGRISSEAVADAVLSCTNCTRPDDCARWLDRQAAPVAASPGYCRNARMFDDLSKG
ncbi:MULTISPECIES: DUF6455 family protein [Marinovum]|jgi:hypothetical protein|uniref:DUF6455 family protein n=1 Tax=Marinovum TaxID=367771 RepID=UPI00237A4BE7|nr:MULTISPECIES: DUF6455 family protein [Marinovum]MDD9745969.1 DUF6455 family protein [Marinovum sp. PR37]